MGCWNATCNITNLPIISGDKVVLIPLAKTKENSDFNVCYPTDVFVPFGLPLFGNYDEYGSINNIKTSDENKNHLLNNYNYFYEENDGVDIRYEVAPKDNFENFVKNVICSNNKCYIRTNSLLHKNGMVEINYMMIHLGVYKLMIEKIAKKKSLDNKCTKEYIIDNFQKEIEKCQNDFDCYAEMKQKMILEKVNSERTEALFDLMMFERCYKLTKSLVFENVLNPCIVSWQNLIKNMMETNNEKLLLDIVDLHLFTLALDSLRKGYLCDCGVGSQECNTDMHSLIAQYVLEHIKNLKEKNDI